MSPRTILTAGALMIGVAGFAAGPASALIAYPPGYPIGTATDVLTISGVYTFLPSPTAQPFAALPFTLSFIVPAQVSVPTPFGSLFEISTGAGSYSNGGQTEAFTGQQVAFGPTLGGSQLNLFVSNLLVPLDQFDLNAQTVGAFYTSSSGGMVETFNPGVYPIALGSAGYALDPPFTGTFTITPSVATPEPATWALMLIGVGGLGAAMRGSRRRAAPVPVFRV